MNMDSSMRARAAVLAAAASSLLLAACAADPEDVDVGEVDDTPSDESVTLVANPWPGSYANANVAAILLESELGVDAEIVEIDENAQWAGLEDGSLDAVLEVWPSGHEASLQTYVEDLGAVELLGELGAVGQIGWFVPTYVVDEYPEMATWEGLAGNEEIFATAETGDSGQFLAADPSFVQWDEGIINSLGLDFEVVQSGSEAAQLAAVQAALDREEPVLFYFYIPHWMHFQYDLTMVELPEWTEECGAKPEAERDCGYPPDVLLKAANADLAERLPDVHAFLTNMTMQNEWQDEITYAMDVDGLDAREAAQQWIDSHESDWAGWIP
jgi:glycine betaine/proline transport system substrate-binding protein